MKIRATRIIEIYLSSSLSFLQAFCQFGGFSFVIWSLCSFLALYSNLYALTKDLISTLYLYEEDLKTSNTKNDSKLKDDPAVEAL